MAIHNQSRTAEYLVNSAAPSTNAGEAALFVSDGTGGLVANDLYMRPASDGVVEPVATVQALETNVIYVSKVGLDANSGRTPTRAKLTIASAITAATALTPSVSNPIAIQILDAGIYTSARFTLPDYVSLEGPQASLVLSSTLVPGDQSVVTLRSIEGTTASITFNMSAGTAAWVTAKSISNSSTGAALTNNSSGTLNVDVDRVSTVSAVTFGGSSVCLGRLGSVIHGGVLSAINLGGNVMLRIDYIEALTGTAILVGNTFTADLSVIRINATTAYDTTTGGTINIVVTRVTGATVGGGTLNEVKAI